MTSPLLHRLYTITPSPLPALDSHRIEKSRFSTLPNRYRAYTMVLQAEANAIEQNDIMSARIVGYFLLEFHEQSTKISDSACACLTCWIVSLPRIPGDADDAIYCIGTDLREKFIRMFRASNARYPPPSSHASRGSFDTLEAMINDTLEPSGKSHQTPRQRALARDGFRCMVTGMLNASSIQHCEDLVNEVLLGSTTINTIETAHILNESAMRDIDSEGNGQHSAVPNKADYAATAVAMLHAFGFSKIVEDFRKSGGVHEVWNLLSLEHNLHEKFDKLMMWFEATEKPNRYKVCLHRYYDERYIHNNFEHPEPHVDGAPMVVEFTSQYENAPPPDSRLLALHAMCARVAHMSGAAEYFDKVERDLEELEVLAFDGSSSALLGHLLSPFAAVEVIGQVEANSADTFMMKTDDSVANCNREAPVYQYS